MSDPKEALMDFVWGSWAGLFGYTLWYPLDTVRIRLQLQTPENKIYNGIADWLLKTVRAEKFSGLYKGLLPAAASIWPIYALIFSAKEFSDRILAPYNLHSDLQSTLSGGFSGFVQWLVTCPADLLKISAQKNADKQIRYSQLIKRMVRENGIKYFSKGFLATLIRDTPGMAVYFGAFEILWRKWISPDDSFAKTVGLQMIFGSIAGPLSWISTYPFDVIKSVIQSSNEKVTIRQAFLENYKKHGLKFFTKGMGATIFRAIPMEATCLVMFYQLRDHFRSKHNECINL